MASLSVPYSSAPTRAIKEIQFGLFSTQENERLAVINIEYPETMYVVTIDSIPFFGSNLHTGMSSA
jgi:hypothetical protein